MSNRFCVIHQGGIPLAVLKTIPLLQAIKKNNPDLKIIVICSVLMKPLMLELGLCEKVYTVPQTMKDLLLLIKKLNSIKYEYWIDMNLSNSYLCRLIHFFISVNLIKVSKIVFKEKTRQLNIDMSRLVSEVAKSFNMKLPNMPLTLFSGQTKQFVDFKILIKKCFIPNQKTVTIILNENLCLSEKALDKLIQYLLDASFNVILLGQSSLSCKKETQQGFINAQNITHYSDIYYLISISDRVISAEHTFAYFAHYLQKPMLLLLQKDGLYQWPTALQGPRNYVLRINEWESDVQTAKNIFQHFGMLSYAVSQNHYLSDLAQKRHYFYAICPLLCVLSNKTDFEHFQSLKSELEKRRYRIVSFMFEKSSFKSSFLLIKQIVQTPYVIIHGQVPVWIKATVAVLMCLQASEEKPVFFPFSIHEHISKEDLFLLHSCVLKS